MKKTVLAFLSFIFFLSCEQKEKPEETGNFRSFLENYHEGWLRLNPLDATQAGDSRYNDLLHNVLSKTYRDELKTFYTTYKDTLLSYNREDLSQEEKTSYDVLLWECDIYLERLGLHEELLPLNQFRGLHLTMGQLTAGQSAQPFKTAKDYDNWEKRVNSFAAWCDTAVVMMKKGIEKGIVLPRVLAEKTIPQLDALAKMPVAENLFYTPIKNFDDSISEQDRKRLTDSYTRMIEDLLIPTLTRMSKFMQEDYLPACRETSGISALPNGEAIYNHKIKEYTTTSMTADEIFALGEKEVARITAEMEKIKDEAGFKGDLKAFFDHVRNKKELMPFKSPEEVIANFNAIHNIMKPRLKEMFDHTPKAKFEVRRTEAFREKSASAEYSSASLDGSRPGVFYVPIPNVLKYNYFADEDLFLHEAIPGHHYQISLQQENSALPGFRKALWYSSYGEGWALYSESLGTDLGLYKDSYQYFGMLSQEMHRAIRLVVDAGMHTKGWTREKAIEYSLEHEAESEEGIISEIERYMAIPGQALSYKIGQLKIIELRDKAKEELDDAFDIRAFHNKVLESGNIPLKILEQKLNTWIEEEKKNKS